MGGRRSTKQDVANETPVYVIDSDDDQPGSVNPPTASASAGDFKAEYEAPGCQKTAQHGCISKAVLDSLEPGQRLPLQCVDLLFFRAAAILRHRDQADVRVVRCDAWLAWLAWAGSSCPSGGEHEMPMQLVEGAFASVDYVLIAWFGSAHYSTLILTNPRALRHEPGEAAGESHLIHVDSTAAAHQLKGTMLAKVYTILATAVKSSEDLVRQRLQLYRVQDNPNQIGATDCGLYAGLQAEVFCTCADGPFTSEGQGRDMQVTCGGPRGRFLMEAASWFTHVDVVAFRAVVWAACLEFWKSKSSVDDPDVTKHWKEVETWLKNHMPRVLQRNLWNYMWTEDVANRRSLMQNINKISLRTSGRRTAPPPPAVSGADPDMGPRKKRKR